MRIRIAATIALLATALPYSNTWPQAYPTKPIRFIVPFPAGGGADIFAHLVGRKLGENMGQTFVVDNRAGASGIIGCEVVALMPEIPTVSEAGLPGFELGSWYGTFAPAGTSLEIVRRIRNEVVKAINDPSMKEQFAALSAEPVGSAPEEFTAVLQRDLAKWAKVARQVNVKAD